MGDDVSADMYFASLQRSPFGSYFSKISFARILLLFFLILWRMGKNKAQALTLPRIRYIRILVVPEIQESWSFLRYMRPKKGTPISRVCLCFICNSMIVKAKVTFLWNPTTDL